MTMDLGNMSDDEKTVGKVRKSEDNDRRPSDKKKQTEKSQF